MIQPLPLDDSAANVLYTALQLEPLFPKFDAEDAKKIFTNSGLYLYPKGSVVFGEGEQGRDLYIICKGMLDVTRKHEQGQEPLGTLRDGDIFGEMAFFGNGVRSATVTASQDSEIFRLVSEDVDNLLTQNQKFSMHLEDLIRQRLKINPIG